MVSFRAPAGSDTSSSSPSSPKCVNFGGVTGVSRQVTNHEHWSIYTFECHAAECPSCTDAYMRYKGGKKLCIEGDWLAKNVCSQLYRKDGQIYCRFKEDGQKVRVEMPNGYESCKSLLKAVEKAARHRNPFLTTEKRSDPQPSQREPRMPSISARGRPQPILPTTVSTSNSLSARTDHSASTMRQFISVTPADLQDWHVPTSASDLAVKPPRYTTTASSSAAGKRGSLYDADIARLFTEEQPTYNLEVREPSRKHSGHHRRRRPASGIFF